eukprot:TRINITY_DN27961_c0_g2_i1.p2 TRINITY_DN27961_c0_g2~~TRINITY_DN27961_c0_g2_i1.p2  ORF type:complete len:123 (-),score=16.63 TRINITY_DN27961_c0_g2_i1:597-920(-)
MTDSSSIVGCRSPANKISKPPPSWLAPTNVEVPNSTKEPTAVIAQDNDGDSSDAFEDGLGSSVTSTPQQGDPADCSDGGKQQRKRRISDMVGRFNGEKISIVQPVDH